MMKPYTVNSIRNNGVLYKQFEPTIITDNLCKPEIIKVARGVNGDGGGSRKEQPSGYLPDFSL